MIPINFLLAYKTPTKICMLIKKLFNRIILNINLEWSITSKVELVVTLRHLHKFMRVC